MRRAGLRLLGAAIALTITTTAAAARPVLLISIDGLQPADVAEAERRGLKIPSLRRFITEGSHAAGVRGVLPTVTYPSHATLLTGASPARHGIIGNTTFDPTQINRDGWYWYASDIKVPTLWDAARKAGLSTANVHWPVSVGASSVTWNLPQIWRTGHEDDRKLMTALATPGLLAELETSEGRYAQGIDESLDGDENRGRFAARLISLRKPQFATVYLTALDNAQHKYGPDTPEAHAVLERIDAIVGRLVAAQMAAHSDTVVAVVSDHGFARTQTEFNLFRAFRDAGLFQVDSEGKVTSWEAMPWNSGGSIAVMLARQGDAALQSKVAALLEQLRADPANGIGSIATRAQIAAMDGNPEAEFYVNLAPPVTSGSFRDGKAPQVGPAKYKGMHGYFPADPRMRSTFMVMGQGIPANRNLGEIDMRAIAPTLAAILEVRLTAAELPALSFAPTTPRR